LEKNVLNENSSLLLKDSAGNITHVAVPINTIVGRGASGEVVALSAAQVAALVATSLVHDGLNSTSTDKALSANQGKELGDALAGKSDTGHTHTASEITDLSAGDGIDITAGEVKAKVDGTTIGIDGSGKLKALGGGAVVYDGLDSTSATDALSANMGKYLEDNKSNNGHTHNIGDVITPINGWQPPIGTDDRTTFDTGSVTASQLAQRVKALIDDLTSLGILQL
jgi:hypothetical protein